MYKRELKYLEGFSTPIFAIISFFGHGPWAYTSTFLIFVFMPIMELFSEQSQENFSPEMEKEALKDKFYDWLIYLLLPIQYLVIFTGLYLLVNPMGFYINIIGEANPDYYLFGRVGFDVGTAWTPVELIGKLMAMGAYCGIIGINLGHEMGHRVTVHERFIGKAFLLSSLYMHFFIEHNRGHHKRVATEDDPASSRKGEILYFFWFRSMIFGYISAWKLEAERLKRAEHPFFSFHNEMIRFQFIQVAFVALIYLIFGFMPMVFFIVAAFIGILHLETVNYVEHYGLSRKKTGNNSYERVLPVHSWNSNHDLGRKYLFELTRHSDHHFKASRKYQVLRHFDDSPQMPYGYPAMMVISAIPPLWFYIMHKRIDEYRKRLPQGDALGY